MKKRAATAENPWTVHATPVVVPDAGARLRAVVGVLLAETNNNRGAVSHIAEAAAAPESEPGDWAELCGNETKKTKRSPA